MFAHTDQVKVPKVYWDLSTKHVLCMEFVRGERVRITPVYTNAMRYRPFLSSPELSCGRALTLLPRRMYWY